MNLSQIVLLLTLSLQLLSNPKLTATQKAFVNNASQVAQEALAQMEVPAFTVQSSTQVLATPTTTEVLPYQAAPSGMMYNGFGQLVPNPAEGDIPETSTQYTGYIPPGWCSKLINQTTGAFSVGPCALLYPLGMPNEP